MLSGAQAVFLRRKPGFMRIFYVLIRAGEQSEAGNMDLAGDIDGLVRCVGCGYGEWF